MNPRVVLYAQDFEPITIITLPPFALDYLQKHHNVRLAVYPPVRRVMDREPMLDDMRMNIVEIRAELLVRRGQEHLMLFTNDEAAAMMLRADFLPGQRREVKTLEREQYCRGFLDALTKACGGSW